MRIGAYDIVGQVAAGQGSTVWKGHDPALDRDVAVKQVMSTNAAEREQLKSEAATLASLHHPHIVEVYDLVEDEDGVWLVQEWVEGANLSRITEENGRLFEVHLLSRCVVSC